MAQTHTIGKTATKVSNDGIDIVVRYHATEVVRFNSRRIILNSNGWRTNTTKTRMNQAACQYELGFHVSQRNFDWFVSFGGKEIPFFDGMVIPR